MKKWVVLAATAALFGWAMIGQGRVEEARQQSKRALTIAQVTERSAQIARTVLPASGELKMESQRFGVNSPVWDVQCIDQAGYPRLTLQIDGNTGDVFQLNVIARDLDVTKPMKLAKADAADVARRWMSAVRPLGHAARLTATDAWPVRLGWMVRFEGDGTRSFATVDGKTGALHSMSSGRKEYQEALRRPVARS